MDKGGHLLAVCRSQRIGLESHWLEPCGCFFPLIRNVLVAGIESCSFSGSFCTGVHKKSPKRYTGQIKGFGLHKTNTILGDEGRRGKESSLFFQNARESGLRYRLRNERERERERGFFNPVKKNLEMS